MVPEITDLAGGAAAPRITSYRRNGPESPTPRTLDTLLKWAAARGVTVPDWAEVRLIEDGYGLTAGGRPVRATYFALAVASPGTLILWRSPSPAAGRSSSIVSKEVGRVLIRVRESAAANDEEFLHLLAHETFEADRLREEFEACGGRMTAAAVRELTRAERGLNNLHSEAWDHADAVLERVRRAAPNPTGSDE